MVVLSETPPEDFTPEKVAKGYRSLALKFGMPIDWSERVHGGAVGARVPRRRRGAAALAGEGGRDAAPPAGAQLRRPSARRLRHTGAGGRAGRAPGRGARPVGRRARGRGGDARGHGRLALPVAGVARAGLQARRSGRGAPLHLPLLRADPPVPRARRLAHRRARRPAGLPPGRGLRGGDRQHRPGARAAARPGIRRRGPGLGRDPARHRGGGSRVRPRRGRRARRAGAHGASFTPVGVDGYWASSSR